MARKEDKLRPYRVDYFDIAEMKENDLALVKSVVVRAVTAAEAIYHDSVAQEGRIIIRSYRYYKNLGDRKKDVFKPVEDLFTANKAIKIMEAVEAYRAKPAAVVTIAPTEPTPPPPLLVSVPAPAEHVTRMSDSSLYDEVCVNCGATDTSGKLEDPCPTPYGVPPADDVSGPNSVDTKRVLSDLQGMVSHDAHEQTMDTFVPTTPVPEGFPDLKNTAPVTSFVQPEDLIEPDQAVGPAGRPRVPHWQGCSCEVCDLPESESTGMPLRTKVLLIAAALIPLILTILKLLHH